MRSNPNAVGQSVYFARRTSDGAIKIGHSRNVIKRLTDLSYINKSKVELISTIPGGSVVERRIHHMFSDDLIGFEWFRPSLRLEEFATDPDPSRIVAVADVVQRSSSMHRESVPMAGDTIGHLTVIGWKKPIDRYGLVVVCRCRCGTRYQSQLSSLQGRKRRGELPSCGCALTSALAKINAEAARRSSQRFFRALWEDMGDLCDDRRDFYSVEEEIDDGLMRMEWTSRPMHWHVDPLSLVSRDSPMVEVRYANQLSKEDHP